MSKQQLLDAIKNAGIDIPANASSARLRELYENAVICNTTKEGEEASAVLKEATAVTAGAAVLPSDAAGTKPKENVVKLNPDATDSKSNADSKSTTDAKSNPDAKSNADAKLNTADIKSDAITAGMSIENAAAAVKPENTAVGLQTYSESLSGTEAADLDYQLEILRKRHELLKLQHAIAALESGESSQPEVPRTTTPFATSSRLTFRDIEHAIIKLMAITEDTVFMIFYVILSA